MTPADILSDLTARGITWRVDEAGHFRVTPASAITPELRSLLVEHKPALLEFVTTNGAGMEKRRQAVLRMLRDNTEITRAWVADGDLNPVRVAIAVRDVGTCELTIAADRWDDFKFIELLEKHQAQSQI